MLRLWKYNDRALFLCGLETTGKSASISWDIKEAACQFKHGSPPQTQWANENI